LKKVFVFLGKVHRALCINIMPHSAPSIGISSALNFYIQGRGEVGERKCFQSRNNSAVEEFSRCRSRRNWIFWILSIRIFIGSKPQIPNGLLSKEAVGGTWRIGNLGLNPGQTQWRSVCLLFKIFFATTQKYILNKGTPLRSHAQRHWFVVRSNFKPDTLLKRR
jgi:hypothetical protein